MAIVGVYVAHAAAFWHYVNDDAYITFRYSRFLADGLGPYFNAGEHVEGYSNFLWMLLLAGVASFVAPPTLVVVAKALGVVCGAACVVLTWSLARLMTRADPRLCGRASRVALVAALLLALSPSFAVNSTSGLETALFAFLISLGSHQAVLTQLGGRWAGAGVAFAAAAVTRPEGIAAFAAIWALLVLTQGEGARTSRRGFPLPSRPQWIDAAIVVAAFSALVLFRMATYDGELLPNTYYAKAGGFRGTGALAYVAEGLLHPFLGLLGAFVGLAGAIALLRRDRRLAVVPGLACVGALLIWVMGTDWMVGSRFLAPYLPAMAATVASGWAVILVRILRGRIALVALALAAVVSGALQLETGRAIALETRARAEGYEIGHRSLARWMCNGRARRGDVIALMDIGIVGWLCTEQSILDISGLTDRFIAQSPGDFLRKDYDPDYVMRRRPRFVVLVLGAEGSAYEPLGEDTSFFLWTEAEKQLYERPGFQAAYRNRGPEPTRQDWEIPLAERIGASRIFEHRIPGRRYLLAAFESQEPGRR
jgi:hypothetical protein